MNTFRKFLAILLTFMLLFSLFSCGDSSRSPSNGSASTNQNNSNSNSSSNTTPDLLNSPSEAYIIECLEKVPCITEIVAVTEETDPMNNLNKPGWYTAHIYFSYELVNPNDVYGNDLIDKGTDAGGSIEVYKTKAEAEKRNDYLATFDGSILSSGSHKVVGTVVVRTSDKLDATQQKLLETNIIFSLEGKASKIVSPNESTIIGFYETMYIGIYTLYSVEYDGKIVFVGDKLPNGTILTSNSIRIELDESKTCKFIYDGRTETIKWKILNKQCVLYEENNNKEIICAQKNNLLTLESEGLTIRLQKNY